MEGPAPQLAGLAVRALITGEVVSSDCLSMLSCLGDRPIAPGTGCATGIGRLNSGGCPDNHDS